MNAILFFLGLFLLINANGNEKPSHEPSPRRPFNWEVCDDFLETEFHEFCLTLTREGVQCMRSYPNMYYKSMHKLGRAIYTGAKICEIGRAFDADCTIAQGQIHVKRPAEPMGQVPTLAMVQAACDHLKR